MAKVTILGIGAMGSRMAMALLKAGHAVTVWNRSPNKTGLLVTAGAKAADTPRAAVHGADVAISMLRDDTASRQVWFSSDTGALEGLSKSAIAIESSTITIAWAQTLGEACAARGIAFLDAPVAGSRLQAEAAQLIYFAGGDADVVTRAEPILRAMGSAVHHAGPVGSGSAIKLAVNALFGVQVAAMAELIGFMQRCGLDVTKAIEIMTATPVCSPAAKAAAVAMLARNFAPMFPIELAEKDFGYILDVAKMYGAQLPMSRSTREIFIEAIKQGYGSDNITGAVRLYFEGEQQ